MSKDQDETIGNRFSSCNKRILQCPLKLRNTLEFSSNCSLHFLIHVGEALREKVCPCEHKAVIVSRKAPRKEKSVNREVKGVFCIFFMFWMISDIIFMKVILKDPFFHFRMAFSMEAKFFQCIHYLQNSQLFY